mmetsp:Transcript_13534/g.32496  ORF Transcript_13534/g.32496 Transcript_13534/m.32496 type:complete len:138 (-) Transcript_13534:36-449(-)
MVDGQVHSRLKPQDFQRKEALLNFYCTTLPNSHQIKDFDDWLEELLPQNVVPLAEQHELTILTTSIPSFQKERFSHFSSRRDLIECNMASVWMGNSLQDFVAIDTLMAAFGPTGNSTCPEIDTMHRRLLLITVTTQC